jgi:hypothetical protein
MVMDWLASERSECDEDDAVDEDVSSKLALVVSGRAAGCMVDPSRGKCLSEGIPKLVGSKSITW